MDEQVPTRPRSKFKQMVKLFEIEIIAVTFVIVVSIGFFLNQAMSNGATHEDEIQATTNLADEEEVDEEDPLNELKANQDFSDTNEEADLEDES